MTEASDWNTAIIKEFRANDGKLGGNFAGAPMVLLSHVGRKSGKTFVAPLMYLPDDKDANVIYIFASKNGAPTHPEWYYNLLAAGTASVEVGDETYAVTVADVTGEERDRLYAEQASRYPGFAGYEEKTAGIRTIPVVALRRA